MDCHRTIAPMATPAIMTAKSTIARMVFFEGMPTHPELEVHKKCFAP